MSTKDHRTIQPYLFFEGRCEEAIAFYQKTLGAEKTVMMYYKDSPEPPPPGCVPVGCENKVMHAQIRIGETVIMASDGRCTGKPAFQGFALSLAVSDEAEADRFFAGLAQGGQVQMPMGKTFYSKRFGMVMDQFGMFWMIIVPLEMAK
jgi:PhnB protein